MPWFTLPRMQRALWLLTTLAALGGGGRIQAQDAGRPAAQTAGAAASAELELGLETESPTANQAGAAEQETDSVAAAAPTPSPAQEDWMNRVDAFFGRWLVAPLAGVLFYDFGTTERWGVGVPFVVLWLLLGAVFCTLRMGFINIRGFWHAIQLTRGVYDDPNQPGEVSHYQALASALSATVGLGNIAGVAIAIATGGPGATFWMIVMGLFGMSSKFAECTLGQIYRKVSPDGVVSGGPMHYLRDGLAELHPALRPVGAALSVLFVILCMGGSFGGGCTFQVSQSLDALRREIPLLDAQPWIYGLVMALMTATVILGGIRRIAATADKIVPFMCGLYVLMSLAILAVNWQALPAAFAAIFQGAFTPQAGYGGFLGVMVKGVQRASFSNEAGVGSASIAHSAAKTQYPVSEGIVALLEPFIDTVVVCTMTALVIIVTGAAQDPANAELVQRDNGAALTMQALGSQHYLFRYVLCATVFLFAFSTVISWSYYGERCWTYLLGSRASIAYKLIFLVFAFLGSVVTTTNIKDFSDLMILAMSIPNLLGVMLLSGKIRRALDAYWAKLKGGELQPRQSR